MPSVPTRFLDDEPVALCPRPRPGCPCCQGGSGAAAAAELFGQRELTGQLADMLRRHVKDGIGHKLTVALLGRYGQGKTGILRGVECDLRQAGIRSEMIDTAEFKPDEFHYEFAAVIAPWHVLAKLAALAIAVLTGIAVLVVVDTVAGNQFVASRIVERLMHEFKANDYAKMSTGAAVAVFISLGIKFIVVRSSHVLKLETLGRLISARIAIRDWHGAFQILARIIRGAPKVLLVDNIDRATVDQQKALLRAIRRHRRELRCAIVVAFDQGPLIASAADPEAPAELLAKLFNVPLQMPPMVPADAVRLADHLLAGAVRCGAHWVFATPVALADFSRILYLLRRHSARFAKVFLNGVVAVANRMELTDPSDLVALMRLHGLFALVPGLHHDTVSLGDMLRGNQTDQLVAHIQTELGQSLTADRQQALSAYVNATRHMHPSLAGWRHFLGGYATGTILGGQQKGNSQPWRPYFTHIDHRMNWLGWEIALAARAADPDARLRLYRRCAAVPLSACPDGASEHIARATRAQWRVSDILTWLYLLHRLWLADAECLARMPQAERDALLTLDWRSTNPEHPAMSVVARARLAQAGIAPEYATALLRLLPTAPPGAHDLVNAALLTASPLMGVRPSGDAIPAWIRSARPELPEPERIIGRILSGIDLRSHEPGALAEGWPHLAKPTDPADIDWSVAATHVALWRAVRRQDVLVDPRNIGEFLAHLALIDDDSPAIIAGFSRLLAAICPEFLPGAVQPWDASLIRAVWDACHPVQPEAVRRRLPDWLRQLCSGRRPHWPAMFTAIVLDDARALYMALRHLNPATIWDHGFLLAILDMRDPPRLGRRNRKRLRALLQPLISTTQGSADPFDISLGDRLDLWL